MIANIDFSAQFGGRDAAAKLLPHFKALKSASKGIDVEGFPLPELTFILRVDGSVNKYGCSGVGNIDCASDYISLDIVITKADQLDVPKFIEISFNKSIKILDDYLDDFSTESLKLCLDELFDKYQNIINDDG